MYGPNNAVVRVWSAHKLLIPSVSVLRFSARLLRYTQYNNRNNNIRILRKYITGHITPIPLRAFACATESHHRQLTFS